MSEEVKQFFSELHAEYLKPLGFKKAKFRFKRERLGYVETVQFQGSAYQFPEDPWDFYVNFYISVPELLSVLKYGPNHGQCRIESIVPGSPPSFEIRNESNEDLMKQIIGYLDTALEKLPGYLPETMAQGQKGSYTWIEERDL